MVTTQSVFWTLKDEIGEIMKELGNMTASRTVDNSGVISVSAYWHSSHYVSRAADQTS